MRTLIPVMLALGLGATSAAQAEPFGGFSKDQSHYLTGRETICTPLPVNGATSQGAPACKTADASQVAAQGFRRGMEQRGSRAKFAATARGSSLTVQALGPGAVPSELFRWSSPDPIARVVAVFLSPNESVLAVEYESRFGGRIRTEVVGFVLAGANAADRPAEGSSEAQATGKEHVAGGQGTAASQGSKTAAPALDARAQKALDRARGQARKNKNKQAEAAYREVLAVDPEHAEARYGLAQSLARQKKLDHAVTELQALARSGRDDTIVWRVEARFDPAFAALRARDTFRDATGLASSTARSLYERLVGFSSTWEQPETRCEAAQINLDLARLERTFRLRILSRCGGMDDETNLKGTWAIQGNDRVLLTLPNKSGADEAIECAMQVCGGEDCLHCRVDVDLDFLLRPVRR